MRIDRILLGCVTLRVNDISKGASALLKKGLSAAFDNEGKITVSLSQVKKYERALSSVGYIKGEVRGLPSLFKKIQKRPGIAVGVFLVALIYLLTSFFVWDVRIDGNESLSSKDVENELGKAGLFVGASWLWKNLDDTESKVLQCSDNIGWISIFRRGSVAYVKIKEKNIPPPAEEVRYSNVVAKYDCVIEEITVSSGYACVKVGDTVKAGDLLISGIIPNEFGGGFVNAEGEVLARVNETLTVNVPRKENKTELGEAVLAKSSIKIFNFSINIYKSYRKKPNDCVIIEDEKEYTLFKKYRMPVRLLSVYEKEITEYEVLYSDKQIVEIASERMQKSRLDALSEGELLKLRTWGSYTDEGYTMTSEMSVLKNIGDTREYG